MYLFDVDNIIMYKIYEKNIIKVDEKLVGQYLQNKKIAKDFSVYYDLWNKYKSDYQVDKILEGKADDGIKIRAKNAKFDERLSLLGLIIDGAIAELKGVCTSEEVTKELLNCLKMVKMGLSKPNSDAAAEIEKQIVSIEEKIATGSRAGTLSAEKSLTLKRAAATLESIREIIVRENPADGNKAFVLIKTEFDKLTKQLKKDADNAGKKLSNAFLFCEEVFEEGQEMLILVTELTISYYGAHFISRYGCKEYFNHNKELLFYERQKEIIGQLEKLEFED